MRRLFAISIRVIFAASIALNVLVVALVALWYSGRATPNQVTSEQMHRMIREKSWNSAGEWRLLSKDEGGIIVEYRLPYFDFHRYRLLSEEFRMSDDAQRKPTPFVLQYEGCEVMRYAQEKGAFVCMPFRDLRKD